LHPEPDLGRRLALATNPISISAVNPSGLALSNLRAHQPQLVIATVDPELDFQSGFFVSSCFEQSRAGYHDRHRSVASISG